MDFVNLIKLIHDNVMKTCKWNEENIKKVLVKCNHLHELNELLLFCNYENISSNEEGELKIQIAISNSSFYLEKNSIYLMYTFSLSI